MTFDEALDVLEQFRGRHLENFGELRKRPDFNCAREQIILDLHHLSAALLRWQPAHGVTFERIYRGLTLTVTIYGEPWCGALWIAMCSDFSMPPAMQGYVIQEYPIETNEERKASPLTKEARRERVIAKMREAIRGAEEYAEKQFAKWRSG